MDGVAPLVLASGSVYRARLLAEAGIVVHVDPPDVDERAADHLLADLGPEGLALELARRKAAAVVPRHPGSMVVAADQVGVLDTADGTRLLTKQPTAEGAIAQLRALAGTTHRLVNGVVVQEVDTGRVVEGVDVQRVTMRAAEPTEIEAYVRACTPFDVSGSYRLEDAERVPGGPLVVSVEGEHDSGVVGLPLPLLRRLLDQLVSTG